MNGDMDNILQIFFQECEDQLQTLEHGLSLLSANKFDNETINTIFHTVHSIKGGASSFGLENLVNFAHIFENALDGLRSGKLLPTHDIIKTFIKSMDILNDLVTEARNGLSVEARRIAESNADLETLVKHYYHTPQSSNSIESIIDDKANAPLVVIFRPYDELYQHGDDARNILMGLFDLLLSSEENISIKCDTSNIPTLDSLTIGKSYLSWHITLPTYVTEESVKSVFEWANDTCEYTINRKYSQSEIINKIQNFSPEKEPYYIEESNKSVPHKTQLNIFKEKKITKTKDNPHLLDMENNYNKPNRKLSHHSEHTSIRVDLKQIDKLIELIGELIITQAAIESINRKRSLSTQHELIDKITSMQSLTRDIKDTVMAVRTQPVSSVFQRMHHVIRETSAIAKKNINFILEGEDTKVDRNLLEKLTDPLTHILRNAVDHGIETAEKRHAAGKPVEGKIRLSAGHRSGRIIIIIEDDGCGIDHNRVLEIALKQGIITSDTVPNDDKINELIFSPGFSTTPAVSDLSGRSVGMDVVKETIISLGGYITVSSTPGKGTTFSLSLPLTLAILDGMLIISSGCTMVVPIFCIIESMIISRKDLYSLPNGNTIVSIRGNCIPLIHLGKKFGLETSNTFLKKDNLIVLIVENESGKRAALIVDEINTQKQVAIKSIEKNYRHIPGISAAAILEDGSIALILDISFLISSSI